MAINGIPRSGNVCNSSTEQPRPALLSQTNSPPRTNISSWGRQVRRKDSFVFRIDSSEDIPSSHESICQAEYFSKPNSEDDSYKTETWPVISLSPSTGQAASLPRIANNENLRDQLLSSPTGITPIIYGHGTALATIIEQKSTTTISTKFSAPHTKSASGRTTPLIHDTDPLNDCSGFCLSSTVTLRSPRRRRSFSADDLILIKRAYHNACSTIEHGIRPPRDIHEIYAGPQMPLVPPPDRPPTPVGMPSWTAAQNAPRQAAISQRKKVVRRTPNRLQRFLHLEGRPIEFSSRISLPNQLEQGQSTQLAFGRSVSNPVPFRHFSRFRPPKSGHGVGPLETHPFRRIGSRDFKSETYLTLPQAATPDNDSSRQGGASSVIFGTVSKIRRKPGPRGLLKAEVPAVESRKSAKCAHHGGRLSTLRSPRNPFHIVAPQPRYPTITVEPPTPTDSQEIPTQYGIPLNPIITAGSRCPAQHSPDEPLMSGALEDPSRAPSAAAEPIPRASDDEVHHGALNTQCWKCKVSVFGAKLDELWVAGTSWCCWIFCGVDINECDDDSTPGCRELGPRRVLLDRANVVVF